MEMMDNIDFFTQQTLTLFLLYQTWVFVQNFLDDKCWNQDQKVIWRAAISRYSDRFEGLSFETAGRLLRCMIDFIFLRAASKIALSPNIKHLHWELDCWFILAVYRAYGSLVIRYILNTDNVISVPDNLSEELKHAKHSQSSQMGNGPWWRWKTWKILGKNWAYLTQVMSLLGCVKSILPRQFSLIPSNISFSSLFIFSNKFRFRNFSAPPYFICPILQDVMRDPVVAADGYTYEAEAIKKWLENGHTTSPMTNLELPNSALIPNHALRSAIKQWIIQRNDVSKI